MRLSIVDDDRLTWVAKAQGPRIRLTKERMHELASALLAAAAELGPISNTSSLFGRPPLGKA